MRHILKFLTSRMVWVAMVIILQVAWIVWMALFLSGYSWGITMGLSFVGLILVILIVRQPGNPAYKLAWCILVLSVPIVGTILYLLFGRGNAIIAQRRHHRRIDSELYPLLKQREGVMEELWEKDPAAACQFRYLEKTAFFPVWDHAVTHYFSSGEEYFEELCRELRKAKRYIFLEYFIIERGYMWETVLSILEEKVREGVEVRLLYDDIGSIWLLPRSYPEELERKGIQCRRFNTFRPVISAIYNNRDHRKMTVIDGRTAFCGGLNLSDEYINRRTRFGHWKDGGVLIRGGAAWSYTVMFLGMWNAMEHSDYDYEAYRAKEQEPSLQAQGYTAPYGDSPLEGEHVGENVYLGMIHNAKRYVYIYTPYLILDYEMVTSLTLAAKSGIDVRIMTPHIPDKKLIFMLTRSYYGQLLAAGVKIYEYRPGFLHTKAFVSDDTTAAIGSINLDFRSLYLHFECGSLHYGTKAVEELKRDFLETVERDGIPITPEFCRKRPVYEQVLVSVMRLFTPLF